MTAAILAPVPVLHIESALQDLERGKTEIAFGSNNYHFFADSPVDLNSDELIQKWRGEAVFIWATQPYERQRPDLVGLCAIAKYVKAVRADKRTGRHQEEELYRPSSTLTDTAWAIFWHVKGLKVLRKDDPIRDRLRWGKKKLKHWSVPEGPVQIEIFDRTT